MRTMRKTNIILYTLIFYSIFFCFSLFASPLDYIDHIKGKLAMDKGNEMLNKGNYDGALKEYEKAKGFLKESDILYYNIANTFLKKGDYLGSTMAYEYAKKYMTEKTSDKLKSDIYYNSGLNNIEMEKYSEAITDLIEALKVNPKSTDSVSALEYARKRLKEQEQSHSSENQDDNSGGNDENNDEQNNSNNDNDNGENEQQELEQKDNNDKSSITPEEAKRILDALRRNRDDSEDTKQNYKGGRRLENDW